MSAIHSTNSEKSNKPAKPYPEFPLFPHHNGSWAKKIRGKLHYFGPWNDPDAALTKYEKEKDALHAGRKPRPVSEEVTILDLVNEFLNHKQDLMNAGEISPRTWADYKEATDLILEKFSFNRLAEDIDPDDFAELRNYLVKKWGPVRVGNVIQRVRSIFKFGNDNGLIQKPIRYGQGFKRPSKKTMRLERAKKGPRMFEADELRKIIDSATQPLKAMILLGINAGFGNADVGTLPLSALDLEGGWVNYHRPKTGITRRCPLWPATVASIKEVLQKRKTPKKKEHAELLFITKYGDAWAKVTGLLREDQTTTPPDNPISKEMRKLLDNLGINGNRSFYALRHTFETIGGEAKDQVAVDYIMGHSRDDMASVYRERISDERLKTVTDYIHNWLSPKPTTKVE